MGVGAGAKHVYVFKWIGSDITRKRLINASSRKIRPAPLWYQSCDGIDRNTVLSCTAFDMHGVNSLTAFALSCVSTYSSAYFLPLTIVYFHPPNPSPFLPTKESFIFPLVVLHRLISSSSVSKMPTAAIDIQDIESVSSINSDEVGRIEMQSRLGKPSTLRVDGKVPDVVYSLHLLDMRNQVVNRKGIYPFHSVRKGSTDAII